MKKSGTMKILIYDQKWFLYDFLSEIKPITKMNEWVNEWMNEWVNLYMDKNRWSFFKTFHDVGLLTELSQLLNHIEFFFDFTLIVLELQSLVLCEVSLFVLSSCDVLDLSELFPGSSFENLWSAWVETSCDFGSFHFYVTVLISDLLVLEIDFHSWIN